MRRTEGFTLVELIVIVFVLGAVLAIAGPRILERTDVNLKSASRNLSGTIKYLYNESIFKKNIYKLVFDIENGEYWTEVLEGNRFVRKDDFIFKKRSLPFGVYIEDIQTERTQGKATSGDDAYLIFMPSGYVDTATIHLRTGRNNYFTLSTNPYTGITTVDDEYIEFEEHYYKLRDYEETETIF